MTRVEHLSVYDLILKTRSPLHIGSGNICAKTDYLYDPRSEMVSMINPDALFAWLYKQHLADSYERFILSGNTRMFQFLRDNKISTQERDGICYYKVNAADALDDTHSLKEIHTFIRDSAHRAYIPGSSVKGALRTVLLAGMMDKEQKGTWPNEQRKERKARQMQDLEGEYLNTLALKKEKSGNTSNDPVNSILRGLSVSDSEPVSDTDLILAGKIDVNEKGEYKKIPLCRECIRPGTDIHFKLTFDYSALPPEYSADTLMLAIRKFDEFYQETYLSRFTPPYGARVIPFRDSLILGGGSGYFAKTLAYPYLGEAEGMYYVENIMCEQFPKHGHGKDVSEHGVSPHTMKYGKYNDQFYPYGVCEVKIL